MFDLCAIEISILTQSFTLATVNVFLADSSICAVSRFWLRILIQQAIGQHEDLLTIVKRRKLQWYGHVSSSSGLAKTILQGTVKGGRRQGRQRKRWEDNIREWTGLEFAKSQRAVENRGKWRKLAMKSSVVPKDPSTYRIDETRWKRFSFILLSVYLFQNVNSQF